MGQSAEQDTAGQLTCSDPLIFADTAHRYVQLHGELDLYTTPGLERFLDELRREGHRHITLDLSELQFLSAAGLSMFVRVDQALDAVGGRLVLTQPTRITRRILAITGLDAILTIQPVQQEWIATVQRVDLEGVQ
ncbi:MAG: STAS domain-containing protein [Pseudonocardiaceae bacterium]